MEKLVLADFDETIIDCDSLVTIMKKEKWFLDIFLITAGIEIVFAKLTKGDVLKKRSAFKHIIMCKYSKMSDADIEKYNDYFKEHINSEVVNKIKEIDAEKVIIASASAKNIISKVVEEILKVDLIIANEECESRSEFKTCYGQYKADRVQAEIDNLDQYEIYVFSDSMSDKPIFELGKYNYLVKEGHLSQI